MQEHHRVWLKEHPNRNEEWLKDKLADGFHIHHIDGNHFNNEPENLVLIDGSDHLLIHNGKKRPIKFVNSGLKESRVRKRLWISPCRKYYRKLYKGERSASPLLIESNLRPIEELNTREKKHYKLD